MANNYHSDTQERLESIAFIPDVRGGNDLEAGTRAITPTSRPAIGAAQYSTVLTLPAPADRRLAVMRIAARLRVNIAGMGSATHLYCSVRVDADDLDHELFSLDWTSAGEKLAAVDTHAGAKATIFSLLADGQAHTFYFLFWADAANQAIIDAVQLWEGVGTCDTSAVLCLRLMHTGLYQYWGHWTPQGSGSTSLWVYDRDTALTGEYATSSVHKLLMTRSGQDVKLYGTVATDLNYIRDWNYVLRTEA